MPIGRDLIFGVILIVLMLEATRRVLGPALPIICGAFIAYVFLGPYLPDVVAFKGATLSRFISQITMDTQHLRCSAACVRDGCVPLCDVRYDAR